MVDSTVEDSWPERLVSDLKSLREHHTTDLENYFEQVEDTIKELAEEIVDLRKKTRGQGGRPLQPGTPRR